MEESCLCLDLPPKPPYLPQQPSVYLVWMRIFMGSFDLPLEVDEEGKKKKDTLQVSFTDMWQTSHINCNFSTEPGEGCAPAGISNLLEYALESKHICHPLHGDASGIHTGGQGQGQFFSCL